jgi:hypothetical protein
MRLIHDVSDDRWWDVANACSYATFFHTPLWADIVTAAEDVSGAGPVAAELSNGTTVVLPMVRLSPGGNRVFRRLRSSYAGCYGGLIADGPLTEEITEFYDRVCGWRTAECKVVESPLAPEEPGLDALNGGTVTTEEDFTQILPLDRPFDELYDDFSKDRRYGVRKSKEAGVSVREATTLDDYRTYYGAYQASIERWDEVSKTYSWEFFERIHELATERPESIKLWVTEVDGEIASGALVFYWNGHAVNWHAAAYADYFSKYINDRIHADIIEDAVERGTEYYDFNPSGGIEGVVKFKSEFGPEKRPIRRWSYHDATFTAAQRLRDSIQALTSVVE